MNLFTEDVVLESARAVILAVLDVYLVRVGRQRGFSAAPGWAMVQWGFHLLLFGTVIDITDNFSSLNRFVVIGNTPAEAFLEKVVGYLCGFLLVAVGLIRWAPTVEEVHRAKTELDRLVAERTAELERSNQDLQHFAHVASHDLREPLRTVASFVQLLERRYGDRLDEDGRQYIAYAAGGAQRMGQLIEDLLSYSLINGRGTTVDRIDTGRLVEDVRHHLGDALAEAKAEIIVEAPLPTVLGDRTPLLQVFLNLLGNAIKFRHPDRPPRIRIGASRQDALWEFRIADNGIGIDQAYAEKIFVIFQRLHGPDAYEGTGIGLATARRIIERHGGTIRVESQPGEGSTFFFTLPAA